MSSTGGGGKWQRGGGNPQALIGLEQGAGVHLQHQLSAASGLCVFKVIFDSEIVVDS